MSLLVPSTLLLQAGANKEGQRFVLDSSEWFDLQTRVQAMLALPFDIGEYQERYGDALAGAQMKECFGAMHMLLQAASRYGSPKRLHARILNDQTFLSTAARPRDDAFAATMDARTGAPGRIPAGRDVQVHPRYGAPRIAGRCRHRHQNAVPGRRPAH
jgi:hypothetical protein